MLGMRRIMIIGGAGSGKSTLARRLGEIYDLPVHHLDAVFWRPGWVEPDRDDFNARVREIIDGDKWVIDGNYSATWPERSARADLVIFLDVPASLRLFRAVRRSWQGRGKARTDMAPGCTEKFDLAFYRYIINYRREGRRKALSLVADPGVSDKSVHLRLRDMDAFLETRRRDAPS